MLLYLCPYKENKKHKKGTQNEDTIPIQMSFGDSSGFKT